MNRHVVYDIRCASKKSGMLFSLADRIRAMERVFSGGGGEIIYADRELHFLGLRPSTS